MFSDTVANPSVRNHCHVCAATSYHHQLVRDDNGVMQSTATVICSGCKREYRNVQEWRDGVNASSEIANEST